jgi:hypothetical protein
MARSWYSMHLARCPVAARAAAGFCALLLLLSPFTSHAAELTVTHVDFAPAVSAKLEDYGKSEAATIRHAIVTAVTRASRQQVPAGLAVTVTVLDLAASRLTRKQLSDDPSLDVVHSKSLGGADLKGEVRNSRQQLLKTVSYRYFAPDITSASPARDPWADARVAIEGFAARLAAAARDLPPRPPAGSD